MAFLKKKSCLKYPARVTKLTNEYILNNVTYLLRLNRHYYLGKKGFNLNYKLIFLSKNTQS